MSTPVASVSIAAQEVVPSTASSFGETSSQACSK